jgi:hypothetical protein
MSSNTTDANCSNSNGDLGTKVGVGVGVPLGVLAIGILTFLFWRESRKRNAGVAPVQGNLMAQDGMGGAMGGTYHHNPSQPVRMANGPYAPIATHTPDNTYSPAPQKVNPWSPAPTYEAPANSFSPQELPNSPNGGR